VLATTLAKVVSSLDAIYLPRYNNFLSDQNLRFLSFVASSRGEKVDEKELLFFGKIKITIM
jgi:hypothetical protein